MEKLPQVAVFGGLALAVLGYLWLSALAFRRGAAEGLRRARMPLGIMFAGGLLAVAAWLAQRPALVGRGKAAALSWLGSEQGAFVLLISGLVLTTLGFLALVAAGFRVRKGWGFGILLLPPLGLAFSWRHWARARGAVALLLAGLALGAMPFVLTRFVLPIDLGPRERIVEGERHITLTGWDRRDYAFLARKPDLVVLQMANADVTDATLEWLAGMTRLRELDLDRTAITDRGLRTLARLPSLATLRLKETRITDAGFREALGSSETLRLLDVSGTPVTAETIQAWRRAKPGRRALR